MSCFKAVVLAATLGASVGTATAGEFVVAYDGFYDRLKVVNKGDFQYTQVNFYLSDIAPNDVCKIKSGKIMSTAKKTDDLKTFDIDHQDASVDIWDKKYRLKDFESQPVDVTIDDTFKRVAKALSEVEEEE